MPAIAFVILFLFGGFVYSAETIPGYEKVPENMILGKTIRISDLNVSVDSPGENWLWLRPIKQGNPAFREYKCYDPQNQTMFEFNVFGPISPLTFLDNQFMDELLQSLITGHGSRGWELRNKSYEMSDKIQKASYRYSLEFTVPDGTNVFMVGYVLRRDKMIFGFRTFSFQSSEPEAFKLFVMSFRPSSDGEDAILTEANSSFQYSDFAGAVKLYEAYLQKHPETKEIRAQILKCYYNLGLLALREERCDSAGDYFRQVLFIDNSDTLSKEALNVARLCQRAGPADSEVRKAIERLELRR